MKKEKTRFQHVMKRLFRHRMAVVSIGVLIFFVIVAFSADLIAHLVHLDPNDQNLIERFQMPSSAHWLGTDEVGRDVFVRLLYGSRVSLAVALISALAASFIGVTVGSVAGYFGGLVDEALMRLTDSLLSLPILPLLIVLAALDFTKLPLLGGFFMGQNASFAKMCLILILFSWMTQARLVRGEVLSLKQREFITASRAIGQRDFRIILREILPNVISPVVVSVTLETGQAILFESALSFLGLGIQPPMASWGNMLNNALELIHSSPLLVMIPGLLILAIVMSLNFLGDGLQDALDPKAILR